MVYLVEKFLKFLQKRTTEGMILYKNGPVDSTKTDQVELFADHTLEVPSKAEREVHRPARRDPVVFQGGVDFLLLTLEGLRPDDAVLHGPSCEATDKVIAVSGRTSCAAGRSSA